MTPLRNKRISAFLLSPFVLALIPSVLVFMVVPFRNDRYLLNLDSRKNIPANTYYQFDDLDNDGNSEKIMAFERSNSSGVTIYRDNNTLNQWNVRGSLDFAQKRTLYITADCNNDGRKEVYLFTLNNDSLFLHCIEDFSNPGFKFRNRFIARIGHGIKAADPDILPAIPQDLDGDGRKELLFGISTGFSKFPRKVYAYFTSSDSLISSPEASMFLLGILESDINRDGKMEILPHGYAAENIEPGDAKYHDYSAWLTVMDQNMKFMFEPMEFRGKFCAVQPMVLVSDKDTITDLLYCSHEQDSTTVFYTFSPDGRLSGRKVTNVVAESGFFTFDRNKRPVYVLESSEKGLTLLDHKKRFLRKINLTGPVFRKVCDIDQDGKDEIFLVATDMGKAMVYREGFEQPAECELRGENAVTKIFSVCHKKGEFPVISFQDGQDLFLMTYRPNNTYFLGFGVYPAIYLGFLVFVLLVQWVQRRIILRRLETEKQINGLQLALIRNQLDPHFAFNAINSVIYSVQNLDKEKAIAQLTSFAHLYRDLVLSAGNSRRSLEDEIRFCNDYLLIERIRYGNGFNYSINVEKDVATEMLVPKLLIQSYAENAVKHGLRNLKSGGKLDISVSREHGIVWIVIEDNGVGRQNASLEMSDSTGKGLRVMDELFSVYNKFYGDRISAEIEDLHNTKGDPCGTKVIIRIELKHEKLQH